MSRRDRKRRTKRIVPDWMLVRKGYIQSLMMDPFGDGQMRRCLPLFPSYEHARSFIAEKMDELWARGGRPCSIGSLGPELNGRQETLGKILAAASLFDHCEFAAVMEGVTEDGDIQWRLFDIRPEKLGLSAGPDLA